MPVQLEKSVDGVVGVLVGVWLKSDWPLILVLNPSMQISIINHALWRCGAVALWRCGAVQSAITRYEKKNRCHLNEV